MPRLSPSTRVLAWEQRRGAGTQAHGRRVLVVVQHAPLEATDDCNADAKKDAKKTRHNKGARDKAAVGGHNKARNTQSRRLP
jgi:ribosome-binding protein aMBF1 (putative translation factor)